MRIVFYYSEIELKRVYQIYATAFKNPISTQELTTDL